MRIAICVITYKRPEGLKRLLDRLNDLTFSGPAPGLRVVIVENDPDEHSRKVCDEAQAGMLWPVEYHVEPRRGIPFARNKAVAVAKQNADFIAFIDDDEVPEPTWLDELLRVQREYGADVVTGPVLPFFVEEPPSWVVEGRFFERERFPTGRQRAWAYTNNVVFRAEIFDKITPIFDERMAMTGGSDSHFSHRVHLAGYRIVWADEAVVYDYFPPSRVTARWILQRAYRIGITATFIEWDIHPWPKALVRVVVEGGKRLVKGLVLLPVGCLLGKRRVVQYMQFICRGWGMLAGLFGIRYYEYHRTHGA